MPAITDPNLGLNYGWTLGESGWGAGMDANLKRLGAVVSLSVKDRDLATPPASPVNGDRYLIPAGATGVWSGKTDQIAARIAGVPLKSPHARRLHWLAAAKISAPHCPTLPRSVAGCRTVHNLRPGKSQRPSAQAWCGKYGRYHSGQRVLARP